MPAKKTKTRSKRSVMRSNKSKKNSKKSILNKLTGKNKFIVITLVVAVVGTAFLLRSYAATPAKPTFENTGVQKGVTLEKRSGTTITKDNTVIENVEFSSSVQIKANNVKLKNVRILGSGSYGLKVENGFKGISIDHAEITCPGCREGDVAQSGKSILASNFTVKNSQLSKFGDGIYSELGNALIESNIFYGNQRLVNSKGQADHTDGIQMNSGSNVTIRNNVFLTDFHKDFDMGSNFMIQNYFGPVSNVLIENNYLSGGNYTASIGNRPERGFPPISNVVVRNNTFAKNTWQYGPVHSIGSCDPQIKYINNKFDDGTIVSSCFNDPNYSPTPDVTPTPTPPTSDPTPAPEPNPEPAPTSSPAPSSDLPVAYDFKSGINGWDGQGNTSLSYSNNEGKASTGALKITVDQKGPYPDSSKTARAGTTQYEKGLKANAGEKISASIAVKSSAQRKVRCELRFYNGRKILSTVPGSFSNASNSWTTRSCSATAPSGTTNVALRFYAEGANYGEVFYVDDAQVNNGAVAQGTTPTAIPDPEPLPADEPSAPAEPATPASADTQAPSAPFGIQRSAAFSWGSFSYAINLNWQPSTDNVGVDKYVVMRNGSQIGTTTKTSFSDSNVSANTLYNYRVHAVDAAGNKSGDAVTSAQGSCFLFWCSLK